MSAKALYSHLLESVPSAGNFAICIGAIEDFRDKPKNSVTVYEIIDITIDESDNEICLYIRFPDTIETDPSTYQSLSIFCDKLAPFIVKYPNFKIVVSFDTNIKVEKVTYNRFDLPIISVVQSSEAKLIILLADGFYDLARNF